MEKMCLQLMRLIYQKISEFYPLNLHIEKERRMKQLLFAFIQVLLHSEEEVI